MVLAAQRRLGYNSGVKCLRLLILCVLGGWLAAVPAGGHPSVRDSCHSADQALAQKRFEVAKGLFEACLKQGSPTFESLSNLGVTYAALGQFKEAIQAYQQALALNSTNPELYMNLGLALLKTGRFDEAARAFARVLILEPRDAKAEELLALCHYQLKHYELAAAELVPVHEANPGEASAAFLLGSSYLKLDAYPQAIPLLMMAAAKSNTPETHAVLGEALLGVKAYRMALAEFQKAAASKPDLPDLHADLGTAYAGMGDTATALKEYQKELERDPNDFNANYFMGRLKRISGDSQGAQTYLARAARIRPGDASVAYEYAILAFQAKDYAKAETLLNQVLATLPTYTDAHVLLSQVYFKTHRLDEGNREKAIIAELRQREQAEEDARAKMFGAEPKASPR